MIMEFLNYFSNVFTFGNILILILGTVGGLLLGAAPGLSPTMAVALLIPFTFKMSPEPVSYTHLTLPTNREV